ncbi:hypothetical protein [Pseudomonas entomophila]|nr:hypothetical protein [Pseudomonas entomophila]WMW07572.1 hypothetical protein RAH46_09580 [Pseudomonas entomophila]
MGVINFYFVRGLMFTCDEEGVMRACMQIFYVWDGAWYESDMDVLLDGLLDFECVGFEVGGVFVGCDSDPLSIPDYLDIEGFDMSFEYFDESVVCSMAEGAKYIERWCDANVITDWERVKDSCKKLVRLYGGVSDLVRSEIPKNCLMDIYRCSGSGVDSCILGLLKSLLACKGVNIGMSGVYLECDEDSGNIPVYLNPEGAEMSFEFKGEYVVCSMSVGAFYIRDWCGKNVRSERVGSESVMIMVACNKLFKLYGGFDDARYRF